MRRHLQYKYTLSLTKKINLEYYFLECETKDTEDFFGIRFYGVEIVKKKNLIEVETSSVHNFSCSEGKTKLLIDKLILNKVSPTQLHYVLDNILGA